MSLSEAFSFKLGATVLPGRSCVGYFDGKHPSLVCGIPGKKILIHSPHFKKLGGHAETEQLSWSDQVSCIETFTSQQENKDFLIVGSESSIRFYDVDANKDVLFHDIADGALSLTVGEIGNIGHLAFVGGSRSLYGYNENGDNPFFMVTADSVLSLTMAKFEYDDAIKVIAGCEDAQIRLFDEDAEIVAELQMEQAVTKLISLPYKGFAYALSTGTIGVFTSTSSPLWETKCTSPVVGLCCYVVESGQGKCLLAALEDGRIEAFSLETGQLINTTTVNGKPSAMLMADYRLEGIESLMIICKDGTVHGYHPTGTATQASSNSHSSLELDESRLEKLREQKQRLANKLRRLKLMTGSKPETKKPEHEWQDGALKANVTAEWKPFPSVRGQPAHIQVLLDCGNQDVFISRAVVFSDSLFDTGVMTCTADPSTSSSTLEIHIPPARRIGKCDVRIVAFLGPETSNQLAIKEVILHLPPHAFFLRDQGQNQSSVTTFSHKLTVSFDPKRLPELTRYLQNTYQIERAQASNGNVVISLTDLTGQCSVRILVSGAQLSVLSNDQNAARGILTDICTSLSIDASGIQKEVLKTRPVLIDAPKPDPEPPVERKSSVHEPKASTPALPGTPTSTRKATRQSLRKSIHSAPESVEPTPHPVEPSEPISNESKTPIEEDEEVLATSISTPQSQHDKTQELIFEAVTQLQESRATNQKVSAEVADKASLIKALLIRLEDARLLGDQSSLRKTMAELNAANADALLLYQVKKTSRQQVVKAAQTLNGFIKAFSDRLEGPDKKSFLTACKEALTEENYHRLLQVLQKGQA